MRHGQSEANLKEIYAGRFDVPLTETGKKQAELIHLKTSESVIVLFKTFRHRHIVVIDKFVGIFVYAL